MKALFASLALAAACSTAWAQATPVGLWKTIDDETKTEKSLVRITEQGGLLTGRIEKFLDPSSPADVVCDKCEDERKDKPVMGMVIVRNAKADAKGEAWEGGDILDPTKGKIYRLRLKMMDGGKKLEVRGYLGPFYRNQQWVRVE